MDLRPPRIRAAALLFASALLVANPAGAENNCAFAGSTVTVTGSSGDDSLRFWISNDAFFVDGYLCPGGAATDNVDTVVFNMRGGDDELWIDYSLQLPTPGMTGEVDIPEIEMVVNGGSGEDVLTLHDESYSVDLVGGTEGINLNGDDDGDDITYPGIEHISFEVSDHGNYVDMEGDETTGDPATVTTSFRGGDGDDEFYGGASSDFFVSGGGDDVYEGGGGADIIGGMARGTMRLERESLTDSGDGSEVVFFFVEGGVLRSDNARGNVIDASGFPGPVLIVGGKGPDKLLGGRAPDTISGGPGNDRIFGRGGNDFLYGEAGNDLFQGGAGNDGISGGPGTDRIVEEADGNFTVMARKLIGPTGSDNISSVEIMSLTGGPSANTLRVDGYLGTAIFDGGDGRDRLFGGVGRDRLLGGRGRDSIYGGGNDDFLSGDSGLDYCNGGPGQDTGIACETTSNIP